MILFYKNGNTLKIHNPSAETKHYQMPSVNSVLATEDDLTKVTTVSSAIKQPVILTPANNSTGFNGDITFTGFETIETFTGTLDAISIAIATDINFANVVVLQRVVTTVASSFNIAVDLSSSDLYIKVKYHSDLYSSVWSNPVKTTTPEYIINKPTIIGPTNGQTGVALFPMISGSDFTYVGVDETHESTTYQIAKDVTFTNIAYNVTSTTDLTSHLITEDLDYETTYYIRMRYNGSKYGNSEWSNTITISTLEVDEKIKTINGQIRRLVNDNTGNYIYAIGFDSNINSNTEIQGIVYKFDKNLNIVSRKILGLTNKSVRLFQCCVDNDNNLIVTGGSSERNTFESSLVIKFDSNLNVLIKKVFVPNTTQLDTFSNILYDANTDTYLLTGHVYNNGTAQIPSTLHSGFIRMSKDLNIIENKFLNIGNRIGVSTLNIREYGSDKYVCFYPIFADDGIYGTAVLITDKNLNVLNTKFLFVSNTHVMISSMVVSNTDIYLVGYTYPPGSVYLRSFILKLDSNLNIVLQKAHYGVKNYVYHTITLDDKNNKLLVTGRIGALQPGAKSVLVEYDLNLNITKSLIFDNTSTNLTDTEGLGLLFTNNTYVFNSVSSNSNLPYDLYSLLTLLDKDLSEFVDYTEPTGKVTIKNNVENIQNYTLPISVLAPTVTSYTFNYTGYTSTLSLLTHSLLDLTYDI